METDWDRFTLGTAWALGLYDVLESTLDHEGVNVRDHSLQLMAPTATERPSLLDNVAGSSVQGTGLWLEKLRLLSIPVSNRWPLWRRQ